MGHGLGESSGQGSVGAQSVLRSGLQLWTGAGLAFGGDIGSPLPAGVGRAGRARRTLAHSALGSATLHTSPRASLSSSRAAGSLHFP